MVSVSLMCSIRIRWEGSGAEAAYILSASSFPLTVVVSAIGMGSGRFFKDALKEVLYNYKKQKCV